MNSPPAKSRKKKGRDRALSFRTEKQIGCPDMTLIPSLNNKAIVSNLKDRLTNSIIYSTIGPVLVVCNPYKWLQVRGVFLIVLGGLVWGLWSGPLDAERKGDNIEERSLGFRFATRLPLDWLGFAWLRLRSLAGFAWL